MGRGGTGGEKSRQNVKKMREREGLRTRGRDDKERNIVL